MSRTSKRQQLIVALLLLLVLVLGLYGFTHTSPLDLLVPVLVLCFALHLASRPFKRRLGPPHNRPA